MAQFYHIITPFCMCLILQIICSTMGYWDKLSAFLPSQSSHTILSVSHRCNFLMAKMHQKRPYLHAYNLLITNKIIIILLIHAFSPERFFSISYLDYSKILLKESLQLLNHRLLFLLSVAATEAGHCWEYLVNACTYCAWCNTTNAMDYIDVSHSIGHAKV